MCKPSPILFFTHISWIHGSLVFEETFFIYIYGCLDNTNSNCFREVGVLKSLDYTLMNLYDVGLFFTHRGRIQDSLVLVVGFITHGRHERGTTIALLSSTIVAGIQALVLGSGSTTKSSGGRNICSCFSFFSKL